MTEKEKIIYLRNDFEFKKNVKIESFIVGVFMVLGSIGFQIYNTVQNYISNIRYFDEFLDETKSNQQEFNKEDSRAYKMFKDANLHFDSNYYKSSN